MSEKLIRYFDHDITTLHGARAQAQKLFMQLKELYGAEEARRILFEWGKPLDKKRTNELKNWALLERYDAMKEGNVSQLARDIVAENALLPKDKQLTPRFRPTLPTVDKHLRLLLTRRLEGLKKGTWEGPTCMKRFRREWEEALPEFLKPRTSSS